MLSLARGWRCARSSLARRVVELAYVSHCPDRRLHRILFQITEVKAESSSQCVRLHKYIEHLSSMVSQHLNVVTPIKEKQCLYPTLEGAFVACLRLAPRYRVLGTATGMPRPSWTFGVLFRHMQLNDSALAAPPPSHFKFRSGGFERCGRPEPPAVHPRVEGSHPLQH
jgi:hypothetical protein